MKNEKYKNGFEKFLMFPFSGILASFILAIAAIIAILLIAYLRGSYGADMPQNNINIPPSRSASGTGYYQALAKKIYKKVYKLDKATAALGQDKKSKVRNGYAPSKAHKINKLDKKTQKNKKN